MITLETCKEQKDVAVKDKEKDMQQLGLIIALVAGGGLYLWDKKRKGQDVSGGFEMAQG